MHVIGTAGHVDHGKSTLIYALTGINPDRLKEEQKRQMTIDLGFAWLKLPGGEEVGIVDVPGHRDFIENMLAGMGGIDAVLMVVSADEGVMPQTREHLAIIDLLGIATGILVLTKTDLVTDPQWLTLIENDVRKLTAGTTLQDAKLVKVSAKTGEGIEELKIAIEASLQTCPPHLDVYRPRLPIDRVFTLAGFGTIVTGTLQDGLFRVGDEVEVLPQQILGRIRGLQTHKKKEEEASPGSRTAVNISGADLSQIHRGDTLTRKGTYQITRRFDAAFRSLCDIRKAIRHQDVVKVFINSAETESHVRVIGREKINAGESGFLQLELDHPILVVKGDRFILRCPSPAETLGGGVVLDPFPKGRHKRFDQSVVKILQALQSGTPSEMILQAIEKLGVASPVELAEQNKIPLSQIQELVQELIMGKRIIQLNAKNIPETERLLVSFNTLDGILQQIKKEFDLYYIKKPLRLGMKKEELRSRIPFTQHITEYLLYYFLEQGSLFANKNLICWPTHNIQFTPEQKRLVQDLLNQFKTHPFTPPLVTECMEIVGKDVLQALLDLEELIQVSPEVVFWKPTYEEMIVIIKDLIKTRGSLTLAEVRDSFKTSRRFALAILEHLDRLEITERDGDSRKLK